MPVDVAACRCHSQCCGGPVNARLRRKSIPRVTNCDSQLSQSALGGNANGLMIAIDQTPDTKLERRVHEGHPSEAHVLLADVRQKFPRVQSAFTQLVQTPPSSSS